MLTVNLKCALIYCSYDANPHRRSQLPLYAKYRTFTFKYVTTGKVSCIFVVIVVTVNMVVTPKATLAGAASASIQNESQAMMTKSRLGT